ncbi:MAG: PD40 domain-containing protein, partial [Acidobacteria bacterium]|nr:PD40 domain-containing protein [Acidobacteriota bacterium]
MRKIVFAVLLAAGAAFCAEVWTPQLALKVHSVSSVVPSPDGKFVVYAQSWAEMEGERSETVTHLFLARADGSGELQLTRGEKSCDQPQWSPDGKWILFLSSRGGKNDLWRIRADGGEAERLTESKVDLGGFKVSPDGKQVAFLAPDPPLPEKEKAQKEKRDFRVIDQEPEDHRLWLIPLEADGKGK